MTPASTPIPDITDHPLVHDVNQESLDRLSFTERACKSISNAIGAPIALALAILLQLIWIVVGASTKWDPFPFVFLLTCSNVLQLILIFVLAVGQRQSSAHAELRAEHDHESISRLLYHQEVQERILLAIAQKTDTDVQQVAAMVTQLLTQDNPT
ncbi:MAG TPA: DUF1003 domain-containing protein [Candidatus Baltobacteraceae bacterium]|nr:DUF1003 domain-containing protein [Candidatus Baltobacteraceae bacterium]